MKRSFSYNLLIPIAALSVLAVSCYDVDPHSYEELSPITINTASDTINVNLGTELVYNGLDVVSALEPTFEWAYGQPSSGTQVSDHQFSSIETISTSRTIDYTFPKVGSFILRLKVDNGESIVFKYFTLNVNSGYDEGVAILCNDTEGNGSLAFVKTMTSAEIASGERQVFDNIFAVEGKTLKNGTGLFMADNVFKSVTYSGFLIATNDENGSIYHMDCKTLEYYMSAPMSEYGTYCAEFGGEYAEDKASFGCFFRSPDGRVFRYDMNGGFLNEIDEIRCRVDRIFTALTRSTNSAKSTVTPFFFNADTVGTRRSATRNAYLSEPGWSVVNAGVLRTNSNPIRVLLRSKNTPSLYKVMSGGTGWYSWSCVDSLNISNLHMDSSSKFVNTTASSDMYYTFDNAIYRWNGVSAPGNSPAITLPQGEQIRDIATNYMGRAASSGGENLLYVATYNPSRATQHKGSLYVYRFSDDTLVSSYEGICDDPVSVIYKYRIN